jgi:23S rRNA (adenine2503-C2)-methyltransferase
MPELKLVYDLDREAWRQVMRDWGEPLYRADQVWTALYRHLASEASQITTLPLALRERLAADFAFGSLRPRASLASADGETRKLLLHSPDGQTVEAVLMRYHTRRTACISTQAGCAMGCVFCATGQMGFQRNLSAGEIIEQVLTFARQLGETDDRLTNVVVMGMGEPFHNYDATMAALDRLNDSDGFNFGARRFTVSTVGLVPKIQQFASEGRPYNLAVSLHAATDSLRADLLPIARRYPLDVLMDACRAYTQSSGRRITFEWALIDDVNDSPEQAQALARLIRGMLSHVNLIPLNPTRGYAGGPTPLDRANAFREVLESQGVPCTIRVRRGIDIQAGCGQLATENQNAPSGASFDMPMPDLGS